MSFFQYTVVEYNDSSMGNWSGHLELIFYDARIIGYQNYEAKNLLSALKFYETTILVNVWGIKNYETITRQNYKLFSTLLEV